MDKKIPSLQRQFDIFNKIVDVDRKKNGIYTEFEVRFNDKLVNKSIFENVFKTLFSHGFTQIEDTKYHLRTSINFQTTANKEVESKIRVEMNGLKNIQEFCKNKSGTIPDTARFILKEPASAEFNRPIYNYDLGYRTSIQREIKLKKENPKVLTIKSEWANSFKTFRYITRTSLRNKQLFPNIQVDLSKVKMNNGKEKTISRSNVFNNDYQYEIEIEIVDIIGGSYTVNKNNVAGQLKTAIKYVLCGIQDSNVPVSFGSLKKVLSKYLNFASYIDNSKEQYEKSPHSFIGPSSITLQKSNLIKSDTNKSVCIKDDFCVTDKADGQRKLLYITRLDKDSDLEIYFIDMNLNIQHTGLYIKNSKKVKINNTIIDGEHIKYDKYNNYINLFAAFDIYAVGSKDIRKLPFMEDRTENPSDNDFRYGHLCKIISLLNNFQIVESKTQVNRIQITPKTFYFAKRENPNSIFDQCRTIFDKINSNLYKYNTDGVIFTSKYLGVTQEHLSDKIKKGKYAWKHSFKWKPPQYNTIDFLINVKKDNLNNPIVKHKTVNGNIIEYYEVELKVGFSEENDGFANSQQKILNSEFDEVLSNDPKTYRPELFYPSNPSDPGAHICHIELKKDSTGKNNMFSEEKELIEDDTIVEFRYDETDKYTNWIPLRVRYDKTSDYKNGEKNFGNAYRVANNNWQSIHNPISEEMLMNGKDLDEDILLNKDNDVYYNKSKAKSQTTGLKNFHNLYVKNMLIMKSSQNIKKPNLIDMAVGKGGDIPKWIVNKLNGVFGIDISKDNIHNQKDGACSRYLSNYRDNKVPVGMFVHGDTGKLIHNGDFENVDSGVNISELNTEDKEGNIVIEKMHNSNYILKCMMGSDDIKKSQIKEKYLIDNYGIFSDKFDICSIQFAVHYMFENKVKLHNFLTNISKYTKINGYFIGTCYDGMKIYNKLKDVDTGNAVELYKGKNKIWHIKKKYRDDEEVFTQDNEECLGFTISVYQESINKEFDEYLVNFNYFIKIMNDYGFVLDKDIETKYGNVPSIDNFEKLYDLMLKEPKRKQTNYGKAIEMSDEEKEISFFNNYFIFRKQREIIKPLYDTNMDETINFTVSKAKKTGKVIILN